MIYYECSWFAYLVILALAGVKENRVTKRRPIPVIGTDEDVKWHSQQYKSTRTKLVLPSMCV